MRTTTLASSELDVQIVGFGARVGRVRCKDALGEWGDVALGFDTLEEYESDRDFFGATIGRFSNRIAGGTFELDGHRIVVPQNEPRTALHGGPDAFDRQPWDVGQVEPTGSGHRVTLTRRSPDGENGFPGTVDAAVTFTVDGADLSIDFHATTDAATVVAMTNHTYWNLSGTSGSVENHLLQVAASHYLPVDDDLLPTGELAPVAGTPFDFRTAAALGARLRDSDPQLVKARGYDHCFVFGLDYASGMRPAAVVHEPVSGRSLEVATDRPGMQVYSGNFLDATSVMRGGSMARQGDAFCLEPQALPDAPNRPAFPSTVLRPGQTYESHIRYRFGTDPQWVASPSSSP